MEDKELEEEKEGFLFGQEATLSQVIGAVSLVIRMARIMGGGGRMKLFFEGPLSKGKYDPEKAVRILVHPEVFSQAEKRETPLETSLKEQGVTEQRGAAQRLATKVALEKTLDRITRGEEVNLRIGTDTPPKALQATLEVILTWMKQEGGGVLELVFEDPSSLEGCSGV